MANELDQILSELHLETAKQLLAKVRSGEATAAELNVARQLLKDNGIDSTPKGNKSMIDLAELLPASFPGDVQ